MPKTQETRLRRATVRLRGGSDRERALYVAARKVLAPKTTAVRARAARGGDASALTIPPERGYVMLPPGRLPEADEVVADARARLEAADLGAARGKGRKEFMRPILDQAELERDAAILRLALRPDVLGAVSAYLGTAPLLTNVNVYLSRSTGRENMSSQLFHCDADDTRQLKLFVLCSEVTADNGPLMLLDAEDSEELRRAIDYRYRDRVTDEEAEKAIGTRELATVEGPPSTVCLVDTSRCFHYGSRVGADAAPRLAAMVQYLTPHSFMFPRDIATNAPFKHLAQPDDPELVRLALGA